MLLQNLYNKVIGFFRQTDIEQETESAKETACNKIGRASCRERV